MSILKELKNNIRDKSRDNFYQHLMTLGIDVSLAERGAKEEKLFNPWHRRSLGVININSDSLISYINIIKRDRSKDTPPRWWYYFGIPSITSKNQNDYIEVKSTRIKSFPVFGKVKSIRWNFNANGKILAGNFTKDSEINSLSMDLGNIKVQSLHENFSGYSIELEFKGIRKKSTTLNINHWNTLNKISKILIKNNKIDL
ncbi:MAG: hypothetical protein MK345_05855 [SAR202 cluster bacterium]|nr:hypothetical protein [SAR202 cluster bacterium]